MKTEKWKTAVPSNSYMLYGGNKSLQHLHTHIKQNYLAHRRHSRTRNKAAVQDRNHRDYKIFISFG